MKCFKCGNGKDGTRAYYPKDQPFPIQLCQVDFLDRWSLDKKVKWATASDLESWRGSGVVAPVLTATQVLANQQASPAMQAMSRPKAITTVKCSCPSHCMKSHIVTDVPPHVVLIHVYPTWVATSYSAKQAYGFECLDNNHLFTPILAKSSSGEWHCLYYDSSGTYKYCHKCP